VIDALTRQDTQGDVALVELLEQMGCRVLEFPNGLGVDATEVGELRAITADMSSMPDSAQTLAVVCAFAKGASRLTGLATLRGKETDRIEALRTELSKLGVAVRAGPDWLEVEGSPRFEGDASIAPTIATYDDHRMAMSFAIAGTRLPLRIENPTCVSKSFPAFWDYWARLK
jgi:3-phosphoshikimate 1-carboxyvinyltransferase